MLEHIDGNELIRKREARRRWRDTILKRTNNCCAYCGTQLGRQATLDHIIPKASGGLTTPTNLIGACLSCNCSKGHRDWLSWYMEQPFFNRITAETIIQLLHADQTLHLQSPETALETNPDTFALHLYAPAAYPA